jgi:putative transcriptional regulator
MVDEREWQLLVRELRSGLRLTQEQFAQRVGVTYSTVNQWENGRRIPQPFLRRRLKEMRNEMESLEKDSHDARSR